MKLKLFLLVVLALGITKPFPSSVTQQIDPRPSETKRVPFEAYWNAQSWDQDGATFWKTPEDPVQESV